jgi:hypothetical protein
MTGKAIQIVLRPRMLDKPLEIYDYEFSKYPDRIRVSFADGRTFVYDIRTEQPASVIEENIRIIRKWKGYVNQPARRRKRK